MEAFFLDIETRRTSDLALIKRISSKVKPPGSYKKAETIQKWWAEEGESARTAAIEETALNGTYGRLASVAWAIGVTAAPEVMSGDDEMGMLCDIADRFERFAYVPICAFNGEFDLRFLYQRMVINEVDVPPAIRKALSERNGFIDPMKDWAGFRGYVSQADLAAAMGIESDDKTTGADMGALIDAGDWEAVERHNIVDVLTLQEIYWRMYP
jgi:3'-5' exonuclease